MLTRPQTFSFASTPSVFDRAFPLPLSKETLSGAVLMAAVLFNAGLAFINAHIVPLGRDHVILAGISVVGASVLITAIFLRRSMMPWLILLLLFMAMHFTMAMIQSSFNPKALRDIVIVPSFIMLGMTFARGNIVRLICCLQTIIFVFLAIELAGSPLFQALFDIPRYYIMTRGFDEAQFWAPETGLFISALRPNERFLLNFLNIHRASSVFLEPVSLGNYCIIATAAILALWEEMSLIKRLILTSTTLVMLIACDGRLAATICAFTVIGVRFVPQLPRHSHFWYMPLVIIIGSGIVHTFGFEPGPDDFRGRLATSIKLMFNIDPSAMIHGSSLVSQYADSGISYFVASQSVLGVAVFWLMICFAPAMRDRGQVVFVQAACIYICLSLVVSYSLFSIKTGALIWFLYGYFYARAGWCLADRMQVVAGSVRPEPGGIRAPCGGAMYAKGTCPSDVSGKLPTERWPTGLEGSCSTARPTR
jgi:putative polymerase